MGRTVYPIITTQEIVGRDRDRTIMVNGREVEVAPSAADFDDLPDDVDETPVREHVGQRRNARIKRVRGAFAESLVGRTEPSVRDNDDE